FHEDEDRQGEACSERIEEPAGLTVIEGRMKTTKDSQMFGRRPVFADEDKVEVLETISGGIGFLAGKIAKFAKPLGGSGAGKIVFVNEVIGAPQTHANPGTQVGFALENQDVGGGIHFLRLVTFAVESFDKVDGAEGGWRGVSATGKE
ncbi:MAG TPA: hypothetical protein DGN59_13255, partial [Candidatus Latescibacteria bacterium]|nr:hypothetical protein [Candidatus Latescibacterota bacterium]